MSTALRLYPYQEEGVHFLLERPEALNGKRHRLLADEQGLGKTPQAVVALKRAKAKSAVVLCPASVKYNWLRKMVEWGLCREQDVFVVRTGKDVIPPTVPFIVVNYDLAVEPKIHRQIVARQYAAVILDECHRLKTMTALRSKLVLGKIGIVNHCYLKILLSGTPIPNRPVEFYIVLSTLAPELIAPYTKWVDYGRQFCSGWEDKFGEKDPQTGKKWNFKGASNIDDLRQRIQPFMLRRELKDVYKELPPMVEEVVYLDTCLDDHPEIIEQKNNKQVARTEAFDPEREMPQATIRRIIAECKVPHAIEYINDVLCTVDKLVVFAYHRNVIEKLAENLKCYQPVVSYGGINAEKKDAMVQRFMQVPECRLYIGQITASGEGVDGLQRVCSDVLFVELDWSEGGMRQARARLYRIGQTQTVKVKYLIANQSLETVMAAVLERKSSVIDKLIATKGNTIMSIETLLERIAVAVETLASHATGVETVEAEAPAAKGKAAASNAKNKGAEAAKAAAKKAKSVTMEDVRDAAKNFMDNLGGTKPQAKAIIKGFGADSLAEIPEDEWQTAIDTFNAGPESDSDELL